MVGEDRAGMTFQEKSLWVQVAGLVGVFSLYFWFALPAATVNVQPSHMAQFVGAVVMLVIFQVAGHLLIVMLDRRTETDERDRWFSHMGAKVSGLVLASGVFLALCLAVLTEGNFIFTHVLLAFWVLAQISQNLVQLILYRRSR